MDDLISRQAAIDAVDGVDWYHQNKNGEMVHGANDADHQAWYKADDIYAAIERVPSAQPVAKDICVPVKDCISRQAAIDVDEMPTADVRENVKGKWIKKKGSLWSLATCSVCGELSVEGDKPFCPNCGAQMIGDKENDERI